MREEVRERGGREEEKNRHFPACPAAEPVLFRYREAVFTGYSLQQRNTKVTI